MKAPCEADEVIKLLNGRWFAKKKVSAETWDGKTKYEIENLLVICQNSKYL
jgi:hypothetical protein